jgi:Uma2 family endonuclease
MENLFFSPIQLQNYSSRRFKLLNSFFNVINCRYIYDSFVTISVFEEVQLVLDKRNTYPDLTISFSENSINKSHLSPENRFPDLLVYALDTPNLENLIFQFRDIIARYPFKEIFIFDLYGSTLFVIHNNTENIGVYQSEYTSDILGMKIDVRNKNFLFSLDGVTMDKSINEIEKENLNLKQEIEESKFVIYTLRQILKKLQVKNQSVSKFQGDVSEHIENEFVIQNFFSSLEKIFSIEKNIDITKHVRKNPDDPYIIAIVGWTKHYKYINPNWEEEVNPPIVVFEFPTKTLTLSEVNEKIENYDNLGVVEYFLIYLTKGEVNFYARKEDNLSEILSNNKVSKYLNIEIKINGKNIVLETNFQNNMNNFTESIMLHQMLVQQKIDLAKERNELLNTLQFYIN